MTSLTGWRAIRLSIIRRAGPATGALAGISIIAVMSLSGCAGEPLVNEVQTVTIWYPKKHFASYLLRVEVW